MKSIVFQNYADELAILFFLPNIHFAFQFIK